MKLRMKLCVLGCLLLARTGAAGPSVLFTGKPDDASNPFAIISERNIFHLNPIPPEPVPEPPKVELPVVKITGFVKEGRRTRALFCALPKTKNDRPTYFDLSEGEKSGFLQLVKILYDKGQAEIINSGTDMTLNLKDDSLDGKEEARSNSQGSKLARAQPFHASFHPLDGSRGFSRGGGNMSFGAPVRPRRSPAP
jgi:hypothetical protein